MKNITMHSNLGSLEDEGLLDSGVQRQLTDEELAKYAEAAPELEQVFDAIIGNQDEHPTAEERGMEDMERGMEDMRVAGW